RLWRQYPALCPLRGSRTSERHGRGRCAGADDRLHGPVQNGTGRSAFREPAFGIVAGDLQERARALELGGTAGTERDPKNRGYIISAETKRCRPPDKAG